MFYLLMGKIIKKSKKCLNFFMISGKVLLNFFVQKEIKNHERNYSRVFFSRPNKEYLLAFYLHFFIHVNDKKNKAKKSFFFV